MPAPAEGKDKYRANRIRHFMLSIGVAFTISNLRAFLVIEMIRILLIAIITR